MNLTSGKRAGPSPNLWGSIYTTRCKSASLGAHFASLEAIPLFGAGLPSEIVYLSLGSNIGDRAANLNTAIAALPNAGVRVRKVSAFYETEPVDYLQQDWFLNCVVEGDTELPAGTLLSNLREIEVRMGSKKAIAKGPRILDIDILLYGQETIATPELQVPHPRMTHRRFVLVPLVEITPNVQHPSWHATAADLLAATTDHSEVRRFNSTNLTRRNES
jgi:2-amino-4-hydroxy-6-hydroxymethyldihydropteridine diphosphokinase